eukprot:3958157-Ditylum_brightwellii.AAC.1
MMPPTIEFREEWLDEVEAPNCPLPPTATASGGHGDCQHDGVSKSLRRPAYLRCPSACESPLPYTGLDSAKNLRAKVDLGSAAPYIWKWLAAVCVSASPLLVEHVPAVALDAYIAPHRQLVFESTLPSRSSSAALP